VKKIKRKNCKTRLPSNFIFKYDYVQSNHFIAFGCLIFVLVIAVFYFLFEGGVTGAVSYGTSATQEEANSTTCGYINANLTLTADVTNESTCFTINASALTLDCNGYTITYDTSGSGNKFGINNSGGWDNITIQHCIIQSNDSANDNSGIDFSNKVENIVIYNNTIVNRGDDRAVQLDGVFHSNISDNTINSSTDAALRLNAVNETVVENNWMYSTITLGSTLQMSTPADTVNVTGNTFINNDTAETLSAALIFTGAANSMLFTNNNFTAYGNDTHGVYIGGNAYDHYFENNVFAAHGYNSSGLALGNGGGIITFPRGNHTFVNNNITSTLGSLRLFDGSNGSFTNTLVYNNSFGQINWSSTNLTTNVSLAIGSTIFIENNKVGLTDDTQALKLDGPANVRINSLNYNATPYLLKNGTRCDDGSGCNISYDANLGILSANVSSFSNYSTSAGPGNIHANTTLSYNVNATGTAFTIVNHNVVIDCNGYTITYDTSGSGNKFGINNTGGWDNITIQHCIIQSNNSANDNSGIDFSNKVENIVIYNNTIVNQGDDRAVQLSGVFHSNISNNTINSSTDAALRLEAVNETVVENNWMYAAITLGSTLQMPTPADTVNVTGNTIINNDTAETISAAMIFTDVTNSMRFINNNFTAYGNDTHGVYIGGNAYDHYFENNVFAAHGYNSSGLALGNGGGIITFPRGNHTFVNNNITSTLGSLRLFDGSNGSFTNTLVYNNSFGQINWSSTNLTTNVSLAIGSTIFIENNKVGLTDDTQALKLDGPAQIEIRNITYTTPQLLKDEARCDNTDACNTSYSSSILSANISSFSNYTARETPAASSTTTTTSSSDGGSSSGWGICGDTVCNDGEKCAPDNNSNNNGGPCYKDCGLCVVVTPATKEIIEIVEESQQVEETAIIDDRDEVPKTEANLAPRASWYDLGKTISDLSWLWVALMVVIITSGVIMHLVMKRKLSTKNKSK